MVGGPHSEAQLLQDIVAVDTLDLDQHDPQLLRDRAALSARAPLRWEDPQRRSRCSATAVGGAAATLGPTHPDTSVYRTALVEACDVAKARGKRRDLQAAEAAPPMLNAEGVPTGT